MSGRFLIEALTFVSEQHTSSAYSVRSTNNSHGGDDDEDAGAGGGGGGGSGGPHLLFGCSRSISIAIAPHFVHTYSLTEREFFAIVVGSQPSSSSSDSSTYTSQQSTPVVQLLLATQQTPPPSAFSVSWARSLHLVAPTQEILELLPARFDQLENLKIRDGTRFAGLINHRDPDGRRGEALCQLFSQTASSRLHHHHHHHPAGFALNLRRLTLNAVKISDSLFSEYLPPNLEFLEVNFCNFVGGKLDLASSKVFNGGSSSSRSKLKHLIVAHNQVSGEVDLTQLPPTLITLDLQRNQLYGHVDLEHLPPLLENLTLRGNRFFSKSSGLALWKLPKYIRCVNLSSCMLSGPVELHPSVVRTTTTSASVSSCPTHHGCVSFSSAPSSAALPDEWCCCCLPYLATLDLSHNNFSSFQWNALYPPQHPWAILPVLKTLNLWGNEPVQFDVKELPVGAWDDDDPDHASRNEKSMELHLMRSQLANQADDDAVLPKRLKLVF